MSKAKPTSSSGEISSQTIILAGIAWAAIALLFYLLLSAPTEVQAFGGSARPIWYRIGTYIFQTVAIVFSSFLCLRNWRSPKIISGRNVWLGLGFGIMAWGIGNLAFAYQDFNYQHQLTQNLDSLSQIVSRQKNTPHLTEAFEKKKITDNKTILDLIKEKDIDKLAPALKTFGQDFSSKVPTLPQEMEKIAKNLSDLPTTFPSYADIFFTLTYVFLAWGMAMSVIGRRLNLFPKQWGIVALVAVFGLAAGGYVTFLAGNVVGDVKFDIGKVLNTIYALGDVWLLIVAAVLLLAFWGGKAAQSWRLIGGAAIAMFIGDLGFAFSSKSPNYQSGDWIEFFWILAFVLWGVGAALEFDISSRPTSRRR
ncbi:hypothetical protein V2H45_13545 [Tumidithrix elongata RA019]|uniref:Uncharacterized protein n=1 Tax=Tumidithrix elongata BACA0141 TaxID=2716417 RepID=A0AAW9Q2X0_9CYAN|nr:hypothetical protein [Tumidithrix elongata RA019]